MDVSEVTVSVGTLFDNLLLLIGALGLFAGIVGGGFLVALWLRDGLVFFAAKVMAVVSVAGFLATAATKDWRPISRKAHDRAYAEQAEEQAQRFWAKYLSDESQPALQGPVIGREAKVEVEVSRIDYLVRFDRDESTATPHKIRVEAKDRKGRLWLFYRLYRVDKRNVTVGDVLRLELKLEPDSFGDGYIIPDQVSWRS